MYSIKSVLIISICQSIIIYLSSLSVYYISIIFYICISLPYPSINPATHPPTHPIYPFALYQLICMWLLYMTISCEATHEPTLMTPALAHGLLGHHLSLLLHDEKPGSLACTFHKHKPDCWISWHIVSGTTWRPCTSSSVLREHHIGLGLL